MQRRSTRAIDQALQVRCGDAERAPGWARALLPRLIRCRAVQQRNQQQPDQVCPAGGGCYMQGRLAGGILRPRVCACLEQQSCGAQAAFAQLLAVLLLDLSKAGRAVVIRTARVRLQRRQRAGPSSLRACMQIE